MICSLTLVPKPLCSLVFSGCTRLRLFFISGACVDTGNRRDLGGFWQKTAQKSPNGGDLAG